MDFFRAKKIFKNIKTRLINKELSNLMTTLKVVFDQIKEEFDEHRESINDNTNEIQSNYEYLCAVESKIDKVNERLDQIQLFIGMKKKMKKFSNITPLTTNEKEVFLVLYTANDFVMYKDIARKLAIPESLVQNYIASLVEKGIPIVKKYNGNTVYVELDEDFKAIQAKENIVQINGNITRTLTF